MNLWLLTCLVTCFLGTWNPAVQAQGVFEDCCLAYNPPIRPAVLHRARSYWCQVVSRSCNLPAVIFHFPHRKINVCGNPQDRWVQNGMKLLDVRNKTLPKHHQCTWKTSQGKNLSSRVSRLKLSALRGHPRSSKKNASLPAPANPGL